MTGLVEQNDGMNYELLRDGFREAAANYDRTLREVDQYCLAREGGPTEEERKILLEGMPDVIVPDALDLVESPELIFSSPAFQSERDQYIEAQYAVDVAVGDAVARNLWGVINTPDMKDLLPAQAVGLFEVNANRGFPRGREDDGGCYGLPSDWLGHVVIDSDFSGEPKKNGSPRQQGATIDYLLEPESRSWYGGPSLPRNAARIRVRPSYPLIQRTSYSEGAGAAEVFLARQRNEGKAGHRFLYNEWGILRGEYRICRAVAFLHDLTDWDVGQFETFEQLIEANSKRLLDQMLREPDQD